MSTQKRLNATQVAAFVKVKNIFNDVVRVHVACMPITKNVIPAMIHHPHFLELFGKCQRKL